MRHLAQLITTNLDNQYNILVFLGFFSAKIWFYHPRESIACHWAIRSICDWSVICTYLIYICIDYVVSLLCGTRVENIEFHHRNIDLILYTYENYKLQALRYCPKYVTGPDWISFIQIFNTCTWSAAILWNIIILLCECVPNCCYSHCSPII